MPEPIPAHSDAIAKEVVDAAFRVHRTLGPGLLESVYQACMEEELSARSLPFRSQWYVPVSYRGKDMGLGFRLDLLVDDCLIVELKSTAKLESIHEAQLLTYMKLSEVRLGLLINFNTQLIKQGIRRLVL